MRTCLVLGLLGLCMLANAQSPVIAPGGILNAASNDTTGHPVVPGSLVSIYGTNLAAATASADSIPLSTNLSSVEVTFNGIKAPLKDVVANPGQINAQVPWEVSPVGTAQVVVSRNGVTSAPLAVNLGAAAPGIFTFRSGIGQAVAYGNSDAVIAAPVNAGLPFTSRPARIGDPQTLVILATGLGAVNPPVPTGANANDGQLHHTATAPQVTVGGVPAQLIFSGMTPQFVGVYQINVILAAGTPTGDAVPVQISMGGITSRNDVTIAVTQ